MSPLLSPKWIAAHIVVLTVVVACVNLGLWQLRRLEERRLANTVGEARFDAEPVDLGFLAGQGGDELGDLQYLRVHATGRFLPEDEVLVRSQVDQGVAGFHVITPLLVRDDRAILVNRGWVPLDADTVPVRAAPPPSGQVTVEGWLHPSQERRGLGPADPAEGRLSVLNRVDVDRIGEQLPYSLYPVYLVALGDQIGLPVPVAPPAFDQQGPHLGYAVQWFGFALVGAVGYLALARRAMNGSA